MGARGWKGLEKLKYISVCLVTCVTIFESSSLRGLPITQTIFLRIPPHRSWQSSKRHYRSRPEPDTPSHPGGVNREAKDKIDEKERLRRKAGGVGVVGSGAAAGGAGDGKISITSDGRRTGIVDDSRHGRGRRDERRREREDVRDVNSDSRDRDRRDRDRDRHRDRDRDRGDGRRREPRRWASDDRRDGRSGRSRHGDEGAERRRDDVRDDREEYNRRKRSRSPTGDRSSETYRTRNRSRSRSRSPERERRRRTREAFEDAITPW